MIRFVQRAERTPPPTDRAGTRPGAEPAADPAAAPFPPAGPEPAERKLHCAITKLLFQLLLRFAGFRAGLRDASERPPGERLPDAYRMINAAAGIQAELFACDSCLTPLRVGSSLGNAGGITRFAFQRSAEQERAKGLWCGPGGGEAKVVLLPGMEEIRMERSTMLCSGSRPGSGGSPGSRSVWRPRWALAGRCTPGRAKAGGTARAG